MEDSSAPEFVFSENGGVEKYFIPIGESITGFQAKAFKLCSIFASVMLDVGFHRDIDPVRKTEFGLYCKIVVGPSEVDDIIFVNEAGIHRAGRKDVGVGKRC